MSIKIEGDGNKENVFSDSDNGMPLWNGVPFGLLPPDLSKTQTVVLLGQYNPSKNPFIVPEDGWIIDISSDHTTITATIDGISDNTPRGIYLGTLPNNIPLSYVKNTPYPVKKGQAISIFESNVQAEIDFAPCMSI